MTVIIDKFELVKSSIHSEHVILRCKNMPGIFIMGYEDNWDNAISNPMLCLHRWRMTRNEAIQLQRDYDVNNENDYVCKIISVDDINDNQ